MRFHTPHIRSSHRHAPALPGGGARVRHAWVLGLAVLAGAAGCDADDNDHFVVRDSAGLRIAASSAPAWSGEAVWRLGSPSVVMGSPLELKGREAGRRIATARRLPDGRLLVLDAGTMELRFYGAGGELLRTVGSPGRGAGQYRSLDGVAILDDSLWVFDPFLGRVSVLSLDGGYVRSLRLEPTGDPVRPLRTYSLAGATDDGRLVLVTGAVGPYTGSLLYTRHGLLSDRVAPMAGALGLGGRGTARGGATGPAALANGRLFVSGDRPVAVGVHDLSDGTAMVVRTDSAPGVGERVQGRVVVSEQERLWVEVRPAGSAQGPSDWAIFDADGRWLGTVQSPRAPGMARFRIHQVGPWGVLAVWEEPEGTQHVGIWPFAI